MCVCVCVCVKVTSKVSSVQSCFFSPAVLVQSNSHSSVGALILQTCNTISIIISFVLIVHLTVTHMHTGMCKHIYLYLNICSLLYTPSLQTQSLRDIASNNVVSL